MFLFDNFRGKPKFRCSAHFRGNRPTTNFVYSAQSPQAAKNCGPCIRP